jgi:autoinducer 2-degrading protein
MNTVLVEVYRTPDDPAEHKETAHYQAWRDTVAEMMAEPRSSVKVTAQALLVRHSE